jgi:hypothetical protein
MATKKSIAAQLADFAPEQPDGAWYVLQGSHFCSVTCGDRGAVVYGTVIA